MPFLSRVPLRNVCRNKRKPETAAVATLLRLLPQPFVCCGVKILHGRGRRMSSSRGIPGPSSRANAAVANHVAESVLRSPALGVPGEEADGGRQPRGRLGFAFSPKPRLAIPGSPEPWPRRAGVVPGFRPSDPEFASFQPACEKRVPRRATSKSRGRKSRVSVSWGCHRGQKSRKSWREDLPLANKGSWRSFQVARLRLRDLPIGGWVVYTERWKEAL